MESRMAAPTSRAILTSALALALAGQVAAQKNQSVGSPLPKVDLAFANVAAKSLDDFAGRTVPIEFFAYW